ncbi:hypothetical protein GCM10022213_09740 [Parerythrobacter jejuensis]
MARDGKFVIGQGGDKVFPGLHGIPSFKNDPQAMARASECDAGPGFLGMVLDLTMTCTQGEHRIAQTITG